jgi:hypothetical protein
MSVKAGINPITLALADTADSASCDIASDLARRWTSDNGFTAIINDVLAIKCRLASPEISRCARHRGVNISTYMPSHSPERTGRAVFGSRHGRGDQGSQQLMCPPRRPAGAKCPGVRDCGAWGQRARLGAGITTQ